MESQDPRPQIGMEVVDNGEKLIGTVEHVEHDHFVVQKGFFFPQSHQLPNSAIDTIAGEVITLRIDRDQAMHESVDHDWADHPEHGEIVPEKGNVERSAALGGVDPHKI